MWCIRVTVGWGDCLMARIKTTWDVRTFDVWGNAKDGYDVNDVYSQSETDIMCEVETFNAGQPGEFQGAYPSDYAIRRVFGVGCKIETDGDDIHIAVSRARDGYPIGSLDCVSHASLSPIRVKENV